MPWRITRMNEVRREFVTKALQQAANFAKLCREYGISRKTGYKWKARALEEGLIDLSEHSRRPKKSPRLLEEAVTCHLIRLKLRHPHWGPKKLCIVYARQHGAAPSLSSCQRVLKKAGLVQERRRRVRSPGQRLTREAQASAPNDIWTVDFKGWWRLGNQERCEPLTIRDAFSRYLLSVRLPKSTDTAGVKAEFMRVFQVYGLPKVIHSDNGSPFASVHAPLGLSRLSAWWVNLGIELDRSRPAHPEDNAAHERMHGDIEAQLAQLTEPDKASQQAACDVWREEFNHERPHESLGGKCPAEVYRKSDRLYPKDLAVDYGKGFFPRKVSFSGRIKWNGHDIFISTAFTGCELGLRKLCADRLEVWLNYLLLGEIELQTSSFRGAPSRSTEAARLSA